ncbi:MAG: ADP-ribosylation factor-like protein [Promethearchaeia archaeon]
MPKKISFLGLDAAGKTSIITAIQQRFGFEEDVSKLKPTRRIARDSFKFLGIDFIRGDFGGQKKYRTDYLEHPDKYLGGTDLVFYVIDIQDNERYIESMNYLDKILLYLKEQQIYPPITIMFHKLDPDIADDAELNRRILVLKQSLTKYSRDFDLLFFETSIYDIKSIMDCFSTSLSLLFDNLEMVSNLLMEIGKNYDTLLIALFDSKGITIGEYYQPHLQIKEKVKIFDVYLEVQKRIMEQNKKIYEFADQFENGERFSGVVEVLTYDGFDFYLLFIIEENQKNLKDTINLLDKIEAAREQIENLILQVIQ